MLRKAIPIGALLILGFGISSCKTPAGSDSDVQFLDVSKADKHPGIQVVEIPNNGTTEHCIILGGYPNLGPMLEEEVFGSEKASDLCDLRFGEFRADQNHALCPKDNSTNPGVEIYDIEGMKVSRSAYENGPGDKRCGGKVEGKKLAKFKTTVTCSSTASILTGYYLSRLLGVANVPPSVLRTLNVGTMAEVVKRGKDTPIKASWEIWDGILKGTAKSELLDLNLTADRKFVYGALSENPKGEHTYPKHNVKPYDAFVKTPMMERVLSSAPLASMIGSATGAHAYAIAQEVKGFSDMIIFDTLLSQQDRLGNIASQTNYFGKNPKTGKYKHERHKGSFGDKDADALFGPGNWAIAERLMLKDNDCGVRGNSTVFLANNTAAKIVHVSPETYIRLRWLAGEYKSGSLIKFLKEVSLRSDGSAALGRFGNSVIGSIGEGLKKMEPDFYNRCKRGSLILDLDPTEQAEGTRPDRAELLRRCELVWDPKGVPAASMWDSSSGGTTVVTSSIMSQSGGVQTPPGSSGKPNVCTSAVAKIPGECIPVADCDSRGAAFANDPARCLRDPSGVNCCFKK
jgi:hypothetical protein